ncbi:hypothetical protein QM012_006363 [Aureobasidium pullulans]|uniref:Aromatic prenyltransferase n=1 Tax=Aureobasidium pullulans TaxID=5580 RepID=A0ABR0TND5_AURPU
MAATPQTQPTHTPPHLLRVGVDRIDGDITSNRILPFHPDLSVWERVNSELSDFENEHHRFWWRQHTGKALAVLLQNAAYSQDLQYRDLKFFAQVVAPALGVSQGIAGSKDLQWPSFMTDDGTPLELSWDWGTKNSSPTIRYSIEPISVQAGTTQDLLNLEAGPLFKKKLTRAIPEARLEWYDHFEPFFNVHKDHQSHLLEDRTDHNTSVFYAFDLSPREVTAKVYFFPKIRGNLCNQPSLEVLSQAIQTAPYATQERLDAWNMFYDFATEAANKNLEHEMLAIDLIDPFESRIKVYFRCRETTFNSVINMMTLGHKIETPELNQGLRDLATLWTCLFGVDDLDQPLSGVDHRTAGILYNVEFKLGDKRPVAKIYLPVRHYASSDAEIIRSLDGFFRCKQRHSYMPAYIRAMSTLL